jgi:protein TonB
MHRDLIIGLLVSLAVHVGVITYPMWVGGGRIAPAPKPRVTTIGVIVMPKIEPDKPDEDDAIYEDRPQNMQPILAPPTLNEFPQIVLDTSFVQPMQLPAPVSMATGKITITMPAVPHSMGRRLDGFGEIFELAKVDQIPEVIVQVPPDYPYQLRSAGITGEVLVDCVVDFRGDVRNPHVERSTQLEFDVSAVRAVGKWKFQPGQRRGHAVNTHVQVPIVFSINKSPFTSGH